MALPLKYNLNNQTILFGPFMTDTDGKTPLTSLTITNNDIKLFKNNATASNNASAGNTTHLASGYYYRNINAADSDAYGRLQMFIAMNNALPVWHEFHVLSANAFDAIYGAGFLQTDMVKIATANVSNTTAQLGVNVIQIANNAPANSVIGTVTTTGNVSAIASNAITAAAFNQAAADKVWATSARTLTASTNIFSANAITAASFNQAAADKVWSTAARTLTASTNIFSANAIDAASFNQGAADKIWSSAARTLTGADNITSNNNKLVLHTDDKVLLAGTTHTSAVVPTVTSVGTANLVSALAANSVDATSFAQNGADLVWSTAARTLTGSANIFSANAITAASFNQAAADKVWATAARTLTAAANLTSTGNAVVLHTDDKVLLAGTTHSSAVIPTVTALADAGVDAIWDRASTLTLSFETLLTRAYQMISNKMNVTDADGSVALRNIGDTGTIANGSVTDDSTTTTRAELSWV